MIYEGRSVDYLFEMKVHFSMTLSVHVSEFLNLGILKIVLLALSLPLKLFLL